MKQTYSQLTEQDIISFMKDLSFSKPEPKREYVMLTGVTGMFMFDLAMRGIELPKGVTFKYTTFKRVTNILYVSIGKKHDNTKIKIDMSKKTYTALLGTKVLGTRSDVNQAVKLLNLK